MKFIVFIILVWGLSACHHSGDAFYIYNSKDRDFYINGELLKPKSCLTLLQPPSSVSLSTEEDEGNVICSDKPNTIPCDLRHGMGYYTVGHRLDAVYRLGGVKYQLESIPSGDTTCPLPKNPGFFT